MLDPRHWNDPFLIVHARKWRRERDEARHVARRLYRKLQDAEDTIIHLQDVIAVLERLDAITPRDDGLG